MVIAAELPARIGHLLSRVSAAAPTIWRPSARDRIEGVVAYSLLGAVACAMLYTALRMAAFFFA